MIKMLGDFFFSKVKDLYPASPVTSINTDLNSLSNEKSSLVWFGHSSYYINHK